MNFLLTNYIYPLRERFPLSANLQLYLDNPRTDREVLAVTEYIRQAYKIESAFQYSEEAINQGLKQFLSEYSREDEYISDFYKTYGQREPYELLARMWIVARYNDEGLHETLRQEGKRLAEEGHVGFFMLEDDNPIIKNSRQLLEYSHLISLLIHTSGELYEGKTFILDGNEGWFQEIRPTHFACIAFFMFMAFTGSSEVARKDDQRWLFFPAVREELMRVGRLLDDAFSRNLEEKLLYIASLLKVAGSDIKDDKAKLVMLVSIIELLVTHNPDFSRFNVEDSINKQFQLKAATLIYLNDKSRNIDQIKRRLKQIYALRSAIAHGDFRSVTKYVEKAKKKGEEYPISMMISELYDYLRAIIMEYLRDDKFVDFLKKS